MRKAALMAAAVTFASAAWGLVGDPQIKTDHPWYPGELSCSTFARLFATQQAVYEREVGTMDTEEKKAIASWYWRNLVYYHGSHGSNGFHR